MSVNDMDESIVRQRIRDGIGIAACSNDLNKPCLSNVDQLFHHDRQLLTEFLKSSSGHFVTGNITNAEIAFAVRTFLKGRE